MMRVLHAGCGGEALPADIFPDCEEVRLDIDRRHKPHVVASITGMGEIGEFDAVYSSHCLEHLYPHHVPVALAEFRRVLKPGCRAVVIVPDLEGLTLSDEFLYTMEAGIEVTAFDLFYGHRRLIEKNPFMAHHSGFTAKLLEDVMRFAGFATVHTTRDSFHNLIGVAIK